MKMEVVLREIREAEMAAQALIAEAGHKAAQDVESAHLVAAQLIQSATHEARLQASQILATRALKANELAVALTEEAATNCSRLTDQAKGNLDQAVKFIRERLVRRDGAS